MAATAFAELIALSVKARELHEKSHYERALEKWRAALAVAETLGAEDCVIVAATQTELARSSISVEAAQNGRFSQAFVLEVLDLLAASAATLRRRRNAGTLMEGKCRPNEGRWFVAYLVGKIGSPQEDQQLHALASLVGYDMFLNVCDTCMFLLFPAMQCGSFERSGEPERAFLSFLCDLIDEAVALMVQPRVTKLCTSMEFSILPKWPHWLEAMAQVPGLQAWHDRVSRAYTRLRQSGVLKMRGLEHEALARFQADMHENRARSIRQRQEAAASGQLKSCALAGCGAQEAHVSQFGKCGACKAVSYCCRDHQQAGWPAHKADCKAARKAAAAAKDAACSGQ